MPGAISLFSAYSGTTSLHFQSFKPKCHTDLSKLHLHLCLQLDCNVLAYIVLIFQFKLRHLAVLYDQQKVW